MIVKYHLSDFRPPVVNLSTDQIEVVSYADVDKVTIDNQKKTILHISGERYMLITSLDEHAEYMFEQGMRKTDNTNVINVYSIDSYDENLKNVYFDKTRKFFGSVAAIQNKYVRFLVGGLKEKKRLGQIDVQFYDSEKANSTSKDKGKMRLLDFFARKLYP